MREVDPKFIEYARRRSGGCLIHGEGCEQHCGPPDACHVKTRGSGGSDRYVLFLCRPEHRSFDTDVAWLYRHKALVVEWIWTLADMHREYSEGGA